MRRWVWLAGAAFWLGAAAPAATIREIVFEGFAQVDPHRVRAELPLAPGAVLVEADLARAKGWLEGLGLFLSVKVAAAPAGDGETVTVAVVENPPVRAVRIENAGDLAAAALRGELQTQPELVLSRLAIARDALYLTAEYRKLGQVVSVEAAFDPAPTKPDTPVVVTFRVTRLRLRNLRCEPLRYVRPGPLTKLQLLRRDEPLSLDRLAEQQRALAGFPMFSAVGEPQVELPKSVEAGAVDVVCPVVELDYPLLATETLPLVDLPRLAQWVRLASAEVRITDGDLEQAYSPREIAQALTGARRGPALLDAAGAFERWRWTARAGEDARQAAHEAISALEVRRGQQPTARERLRLGQLYAWLGQSTEAAGEFAAALAAQPEPSVMAAAYADALVQLGTLAAGGDAGARDRLVALAREGSRALAALPARPDLETVTQAARFFYVGLTLASTQDRLRPDFRLNSPLLGRLLKAVVELAGDLPDAPPADPAARRQRDRTAHHLAKLLVGIGFAGRSVGPEVADEQALKVFLNLLRDVRADLLDRGVAEADDPLVPLTAGVCDLLTGDPTAARAQALGALRRFPLNERLVDLFVVATVANPFSNLSEREAVSALRKAVAGVAALVADRARVVWGEALLLAKLSLALREALPAETAETRETLRRGAAAAARLATEREPSQPAGWWLLGIALLKGPSPAEAIDCFQTVGRLRPSNNDARYALGLAHLVAGRTDEGLRLMRALATPAPAGP